MKPSFFQKAVINFNRSDTGDIINVNQNNIPMYATTDGTKIKDSGISKESLATVISQSTETVNHISNNQIHVTQSDKNSWDSAVSDINSHINSDTSNIIHITQADRNNWNSKLSNEDIQVIVNNYDTALENHARNKNINVYHITLEQLNKLINTYTKNEVDNIVSSVVTGIDWKEAVQSYEDLANPSSELLIERPELANPEEGWTINTIEHGITYRYRAAKIHEIDTFAQLINIVPEDKDLDLYMVHESGDEIYKYDDDPENGYDIATENDVINTNISATIKGAKIVDEGIKDKNCYWVKVQLPIFGERGSIASAVIPQSGKFVSAPVDAVRVQKSKTTLEKKEFDLGKKLYYTGVIVDCSGLGIDPTFAPQIRDTNGRSIYGAENVPIDFAISKGMVEYAKSMDTARASSRAGSNPLVVKAIAVTGGTNSVNKVNAIISAEDGDRILLANEVNMDIIHSANVVFVR